MQPIMTLPDAGSNGITNYEIPALINHLREQILGNNNVLILLFVFIFIDKVSNIRRPGIFSPHG
jgi:hypothetical protein